MATFLKNSDLFENLNFQDFERFFNSQKNRKKAETFLEEKTDIVFFYLFDDELGNPYDTKDLQRDFGEIKHLQKEGARFVASLGEGFRVNVIEALEAMLANDNQARRPTADKIKEYLAITTLALMALYDSVIDEPELTTDGRDALLFEIAQGTIALRNWYFTTPTKMSALLQEKRAMGKRGVAKRDAAKQRIMNDFIQSRLHGSLQTAKSNSAAARTFVGSMPEADKNTYRPPKPNEDPRELDQDGLIERSLLRSLQKHRRTPA